MVTVMPLEALTVSVLNPTYEKRRRAPLFTLSVNCPSALVAVPFVVPSTCTVAPTTGSFCASTTFPVTFVCWAKAADEISNAATINRNDLTVVGLLIFFFMIFNCFVFA